MKNRRIIALLMVMAMLVCIAGCTSGTDNGDKQNDSADLNIPEDYTLTPLDQLKVDTSKDADREAYDIGVMFVDMANEYYVTTAKGCEHVRQSVTANTLSPHQTTPPAKISV